MNGQIKRNDIVRIEHSERLMPVRMAYREQQPHRLIRPLKLTRLWPRQRRRKSAHRLLARRVGGERAGGVHKQHGEARLGLGHVCLRCQRQRPPVPVRGPARTGTRTSTDANTKPGSTRHVRMECATEQQLFAALRNGRAGRDARVPCEAVEDVA